MLTWSLSGLIQHLANVAHGYDKRAELAAAQWMSGHYAAPAMYSGINKLPGPFQRLILRELEEGDTLVQEGENPKEFDEHSFACDCCFWLQYQLPCRHLFQVDMLIGQIIREEHWDEVSFVIIVWTILIISVPSSI